MELRATLPETTGLDRLLKIIQGLSFEELVGAVYKAFPEYKAVQIQRPSSSGYGALMAWSWELIALLRSEGLAPLPSLNQYASWT